MNKKEANPIFLWAVDPFASLKLQKEAGRAIQNLSNHWDFQIQPVYAAAHPALNLPEEFTQEIYREILGRSQPAFDRLIQGIKLRHLLPFAVLKASGRAVADQVIAVLDYADQIGAQMIIASTRAKAGPARWFFGSFAETLSLRSSFPLLTVNPSWHPKHGFKDILFPTDFSNESHQAFLKTVAYAKELKNRIHLFHKFMPAIALTWDYSFSSARFYQEWANELLRSDEAHARKWAKQAKELGVPCTWEVESEGGGTATDAILRKSLEQPRLIAIASRTGPIETAILGSVTRQVIRGASVPILVIHPMTGAETGVRPGLKGRSEEKSRNRFEELKNVVF